MNGVTTLINGRNYKWVTGVSYHIYTGVSRIVYNFLVGSRPTGPGRSQLLWSTDGLLGFLPKWNWRSTHEISESPEFDIKNMCVNTPAGLSRHDDMLPPMNFLKKPMQNTRSLAQTLKQTKTDSCSDMDFDVADRKQKVKSEIGLKLKPASNAKGNTSAHALA